MTSGFSLRGMLAALVIVALGLPIAILGLFRVVNEIDGLNAKVATAREAQLQRSDALRLQIEEETSVRGFAATHDKAFREAFRDAAREFPQRVSDLRARLTGSAEDRRAIVTLDDAVHQNRSWLSGVAEPIFARTTPHLTDERARTLLARFDADLEIIASITIVDYHRLILARAAAQRRVSFFGYAALTVIALQVLTYAFVGARLRRELARERRVTALLQRAFTTDIVTNVQLEIGAMYVSATRGATVGGDVYDVFPLDEHRTFVVIADVSGKGVGAALDSTFVKYSLRAFASEHADIETVVTKFNALYGRAQRAPEAFVVVFAGIFDCRTAQLRYVNAGHEAAYVVRSGQVELLVPTSPIVGLGDMVPYVAANTTIGLTDLLFLATDGLTEARDPQGRFLTSEGVMSWLRETNGAPPQMIVDDLARRLKKYTHARSKDDLALLAVRPRRLTANVI